MTLTSCWVNSRTRSFSPRPWLRSYSPAATGSSRGKQALRKYWAEGLRLTPDPHFDVVGVYLGVGALVINYSNQKGALVSEVLLFEGDLVKEGYGTYLDAVHRSRRGDTRRVTRSTHGCPRGTAGLLEGAESP